MDWQQAAVSSGAVIITWLATHFTNKGRNDKRSEVIEETQQRHGVRLDEHDDKFEELNTKFVPRQELQGTMDAIRHSQERTERWMERMIFKRIAPAPSDDVHADS